MKGQTKKQMKKVLFLMFLLVFALITVSNVTADGAIEAASPEVVRQVTTAPSDIDKDWPIVRVERTEEFDIETGTKYISVLIVRQSALGSTISDGDEICAETTLYQSCPQMAEIRLVKISSNFKIEAI